MRTIVNYFQQLSRGKTVLWCYLIWYLMTVLFHFDPAPAIWLNSLGISAVIGCALMLSISPVPGKRVDRWQTFRLFLMPFCVSSFSSLIKGHGFILIFPPTAYQLLCSVTACLLFLACIFLLKHRQARSLS